MNNQPTAAIISAAALTSNSQREPLFGETPEALTNPFTARMIEHCPELWARFVAACRRERDAPSFSEVEAKRRQERERRARVRDARARFVAVHPANALSRAAR